MHFRTLVTNMRNLAEVRSLGGEADFRQVILTAPEISAAGSASIGEPSSPGGLNRCMRFPAEQLISQLPLPCSSFVAGETGNQITLLWATRPV